MLRGGNSYKYFLYIDRIMSWTRIDGLEVKENQLRVQRLRVQDWQSSSMGAETM